MGRDTTILSHFPAFMRTGNSGKVMGDISTVLGGGLDERERRMTDILRSHRLLNARHELDLHRLAALLGLEAADFALIRKFYLSEVYGGRDKDSYKIYIDTLRKLIQRTVSVFTDGCGTVWSLLEGTSILLAAENMLDKSGNPVLDHPDVGITVDGVNRGGFIHRLAIKYKTVKNESLVDTKGSIYLIENPLFDKQSEEKERRQGDRFRITKGGFFDTTPAIKVTGVQKRTVYPQVINLTTQQGLGFLGTVMQGQTLLFTADGKALLDGLDVTDRCYYFEGALFDEQSSVASDISNQFVVVEPEGALQRKFPRPGLIPLSEITVPKLPLGESDWRFSVREGVFDGDAFNRCVFTLPEEAILLKALPASGKTQLCWQEHELYALTILIPDDLQALDDSLDDVDLTAWIHAGLERFRSAGIRVNVDYYSDEWILDHSVLRDTKSLTGSGIFFDGTVI